MEQPLAVANYFIEKALSDGTELTPMKLVKLTYIAHGWYLALSDGKPLISDSVQAWKYGPVVPEVYHRFKRYGSGPITSVEQRLGATPSVSDPKITKFLDRIWNVYGKYTGLQLSTLTHRPGTPWDIVWNQNNGKNSLDVTIPNGIIEDHYKSKMVKPQTA